MSNLLINVEDDFIKTAGDRPSLGTASIVSHLKKNKINAELYDMNVNPSYKKLKNYIFMNDINNIGISMTTPQYKEAHNLAKKLRIDTPFAKLIAGGPHVTAVNGELPNFWDHIVLGDGEHAMENIVKGFEKRKLVIGERVKDLDIMPRPYRDPVLMDKYKLEIEGKKASTIMTSRGCIYHCSFCSEPNINKGYRKRSIDNIISEMKYLKEDFGIEALIIYDDIFAIDNKRTKELARRMIDENVDMIYRATTRATDILRDPDMLPLLKDSGCIELCLGVESGDNRVLKTNDKGMSTGQNMIALSMIKHAGIRTLSYMITGLPGFSEHTEAKSLEFLKESGVEDAGWYLLAPFPSSDIWRNPKKYGINIFKNEIVNDKWDITQVRSNNENMKCYFEYEGMPREKIKDIWLENINKWEEYKNG